MRNPALVMEKRREHLELSGIDADNLDERLMFEDRFYRMKLTALVDEYRRAVYQDWQGYQWRAISHVVHDRLERLEPKDHTKFTK